MFLTPFHPSIKSRSRLSPLPLACPVVLRAPPIHTGSPPAGSPPGVRPPPSHSPPAAARRPVAAPVAATARPHPCPPQRRSGHGSGAGCRCGLLMSAGPPSESRQFRRRGLNHDSPRQQLRQLTQVARSAQRLHSWKGGEAGSGGRGRGGTGDVGEGWYGAERVGTVLYNMG